MSLLSQNPYAGIDWDETTQLKFGQHYHTRAGSFADQPADIVDMTCDNPDLDREFDVLAMGQGNEDEPPYHPWEKLDQYDPDDYDDMDEPWDSRDPTSVEALEVPYHEADRGDEPEDMHINVKHTWMEQILAEDDNDKLQEVEDDHATDNGAPQAIANFAHPGRYFDEGDPEDGFDTYKPYFQKWDVDVLPGITIYDKEWIRTGPHDAERRDVPNMCDMLLEHFLAQDPPRQIWLFGEEDPNDGGDGEDRGYNVRWNEVLIPDDRVDYADQDGMREAHFDAIMQGRFFAVQRKYWEEENDNPYTIPTIHSIDVNEDTISIDASDYQEIQWISGTTDQNEGRVVATGPSITLQEEYIPYVRARIHDDGDYSEEPDPDAEISTQAFTLQETVDREYVAVERIRHNDEWIPPAG